MITTLILLSLFFTTVRCHLAFIWLNNQQFQCSQARQNVHESLQHQYFCVSYRIWRCLADVNTYSHGSVISLDYFCGFIDGRNALHSRTIWNIALMPNIHIHFSKFLFAHNYWYCDFDYLRVYNNNKSSTFCGSRIPWVYDASDSKVKIILVLQPLGRQVHHLKLQYYVASVLNNQHSIIFTKPSAAPMINMHLLNMDQNAFESFHFISNRRLDIVHLAAFGLCSKDQVVCHDGPGIKSPVIQSNQSELKWLSSTFQMLCKVSRGDNVCSKAPRLHYHSVHARDDQVENLVHVTTTPRLLDRLQLDETERRGTNKYVYFHHANVRAHLLIYYWNISFPYMLYEGISCMYGGIYIVRTLLSKDSEILALCTKPIHDGVNYPTHEIHDLRNVSVIIIHYSEYSTQRILFSAMYDDMLFMRLTPLPFNQAHMKDKTIKITIPTLTYYFDEVLINSFQLNLRNIQYINVTTNNRDMIFLDFHHAYSDTLFSCISLTIHYSPYLSNIKGRQYDVETILMDKKHFYSVETIYSVIVDISTCNFPSGDEYWILQFRKLKPFLDNFDFRFLPTDALNFYNFGFRKKEWFLVHLEKPEDVPPYAIWRVWIEYCPIHGVHHVSLEFIFDNYNSSSVYEWNHFNNTDGFYMTVDKAVNILFESDDPISSEYCGHYYKDFSVRFVRHFIYDDRVTEYVVGQTPQGNYFTFHNQR